MLYRDSLSAAVSVPPPLLSSQGPSRCRWPGGGRPRQAGGDLLSDVPRGELPSS